MGVRDNSTENLGSGNTTRNTSTESRVAGSDNETESLAVGNTARAESGDGSRMVVSVEENRDGGRCAMEGRTPRDGIVVESTLAEDTQLPREVTQNLNLPEIDIGAAMKNMGDLLSSKQIIEHHLAFAEECVSKSIYPLGLKTFVPCVAYKADDRLRKQWKNILHNSSIELLALCRNHYMTLLDMNNTKIQELEDRRP